MSNTSSSNEKVGIPSNSDEIEDLSKTIYPNQNDRNIHGRFIGSTDKSSVIHSGDDTDDDDVEELFKFEQNNQNHMRPGIYKEKKEKLQKELDILNNEHNKLGDIMNSFHSNMSGQNEYERNQNEHEEHNFIEEFSNDSYETPQEIPRNNRALLDYSYLKK
jgi:hypothetical protein